MGILHISMDKNGEKRNFRPFSTKFWRLTPMVFGERVTSWGVCTFLNLTTYISRITLILVDLS